MGVDPANPPALAATVQHITLTDAKISTLWKFGFSKNRCRRRASGHPDEVDSSVTTIHDLIGTVGADLAANLRASYTPGYERVLADRLIGEAMPPASLTVNDVLDELVVGHLASGVAVDCLLDETDDGSYEVAQAMARLLCAEIRRQGPEQVETAVRELVIDAIVAEAQTVAVLVERAMPLARETVAAEVDATLAAGAGMTTTDTQQTPGPWDAIRARYAPAQAMAAGLNTTVATDLLAIAKDIAAALDQHFDPAQSRIRQVIALAEEVGEFVGAYRRAAGMARRIGTWADVEAELADVVITAYVTAVVLGIDLDVAIARKRDVLFSRGWRDNAPATEAVPA